MPATGARRRLLRFLTRAVFATTLVSVGLLIVIPGIRAQTDPDSSPGQGPDHYYYQFYGVARDVTIDGEPIQAGDSITPILNGESVKAAVVAENGFFQTFKNDVTMPPIGVCEVVYLVESQRHERQFLTESFSYAKGCGDIEVKLELFTSRQGSESGSQSEQPAEQGADETESSQASQSDDPAQSSREEASEAEEADDLMEQESSETGEQEAASVRSEADSGKQRPNAPQTGTGGLNGKQPERDWQTVAGTVAVLATIISGAMLLIRRRSDQSHW
jgi:hypothetical protein